MANISITKAKLNKICEFNVSELVSEALRTNLIIRHKGWIFKAFDKLTGPIDDENSSLYIYVRAYSPKKEVYIITDETKCFY